MTADWAASYELAGLVVVAVRPCLAEEEEGDALWEAAGQVDWVNRIQYLLMVKEWRLQTRLGD